MAAARRGFPERKQRRASECWQVGEGVVCGRELVLLSSLRLPDLLPRKPAELEASFTPFFCIGG